MPEVSGRVIPTGQGVDLVLARALALPVEEAWAYLTDTALTAEWFGAWEGDARPGGAVRIRLMFEEGEPAVRARILACKAPRHLALHTVDEYGSWKLELLLEEDGDDSLLTFTHHLDADADADVGDIGPGWEYYLDLLVAATEGTEEPHFDEYYPALREKYLNRLS